MKQNKTAQKVIKRAPTLFILLFATSTVFSQQNISLPSHHGEGLGVGLVWCLEQGLANNLSIRIADNRQQTAAENATRANAGQLPSVTASAGYGLDLTSASSNARATGQTTTNTNYLDQSLQAQVGLTWTAFDGFASQARYKELQILRQQGDLNRRMAAEDLIADITAEYYNCIQQRIRLRNYQNAARLSRERMRIVEARYNIGSFSRLDYMQAKVDFNADSTKYMRQQEALQASLIELGRLINNAEWRMQNAELAEMEGMGQNSPAPSVPGDFVVGFPPLADTLIAVAPALDYAALWQDVQTYNTDLQNTDLQTGLAEQSLRRVLARNYPSLKLNASYGYNHNRYDIAANRWTNRWGPSAGVSVSYNIFDGTRRAARRAAERDLDNANLQHEQLMQNLQAKFNTLCQSHKNNLQVLALEEQNLAAAEENYNIARERYLLGDLSGFQMREAQQSLLDAEERILRAAYDTKTNEISLMLISGGIERYLQ